VDAETRDRWVVETADRTLDRIERFDAEGNEYGSMADEQYDLPLAEYKQAAVEALQSLEAEDGESDEPAKVET